MRESEYKINLVKIGLKIAEALGTTVTRLTDVEE